MTGLERDRLRQLAGAARQWQSGIVPSAALYLGTGRDEVIRIYFLSYHGGVEEGANGEAQAPYLSIDQSLATGPRLTFNDGINVHDVAGSTLGAYDIDLLNPATGAVVVDGTTMLSSYTIADRITSSPLPIDLRKPHLLIAHDLPIKPSRTYGVVDAGTKYTISSDGMTLTMDATVVKGNLHPWFVFATRLLS